MNHRGRSWRVSGSSTMRDGVFLHGHGPWRVTAPQVVVSFSMAMMSEMSDSSMSITAMLSCCPCHLLHSSAPGGPDRSEQSTILLSPIGGRRSPCACHDSASPGHVAPKGYFVMIDAMRAQRVRHDGDEYVEQACSDGGNAQRHAAQRHHRAR